MRTVEGDVALAWSRAIFCLHHPSDILVTPVVPLGYFSFQRSCESQQRK